MPKIRRNSRHMNKEILMFIIQTVKICCQMAFQCMLPIPSIPNNKGKFGGEEPL